LNRENSLLRLWQQTGEHTSGDRKTTAHREHGRESVAVDYPTQKRGRQAADGDG